MSRFTELEFAELLSRRGMKTKPHRFVGPVRREATQQVESPKQNKYRAKKTVVDSICFDSKKEAARYSDLKLLEQAGQIKNLRLQVPYVFMHNAVKICAYRCDFAYYENGRFVVEDVKGKRTRDYVIKRNLMRAFYGIEILET